MSERSELRRRREERMENGVKNLKGARLFPITSSNLGFGDVSVCRLRFLLIYNEQEMCHFALGVLSKFEGISLS